VTRFARLLVAVFVVGAASLLAASPAAAHTDFESSTPAADAVVDEPVSIVTLVFTSEAIPAGDQFLALTPAGDLQEPVEIRTSDDKTFALLFEPPLAGGQIGIRWSVQSGDAHVVEGAFAFTVDAPAAAPTTTTPAPPPAGDETETLETEPPTTDIDVALPSTTPAPAPTTTIAAASPLADPPTSLEEFLAVDNSRPGEGTATIGRVVGFLGATLGLGAFAFVAAAMRGQRNEIARAVGAVRLLGGVIIVGAAIEYVGVSRIGGDSLAGTWSSSAGLATVLRLIGGAGLLIGLSAAVSPGTPATARTRSLSAAVVGDRAAERGARPERNGSLHWVPTGASWPAFLGAALIVVSFWFDGHTVTKGMRPLHALVNSVHVVAGSVWVGGVVAMAALAWSRARSDRPMRGVEMVVRFSKVATIALASVVVAGLVMALLVLDSFGDLTGTEWGQILLLKTGAVGLAAIGGAYNHFRLVPKLDADPDSPELRAELRSTVTAEAIVLVFVVLVTAWLVAAAI